MGRSKAKSSWARWSTEEDIKLIGLMRDFHVSKGMAVSTACKLSVAFFQLRTRYSLLSRVNLLIREKKVNSKFQVINKGSLLNPSKEEVRSPEKQRPRLAQKPVATVRKLNSVQRITAVSGEAPTIIGRTKDVYVLQLAESIFTINR